MNDNVYSCRELIFDPFQCFPGPIGTPLQLHWPGLFFKKGLSMNSHDKHTYTQKPLPKGWAVFTLTFAVAGVTQRQDMIKTSLPIKDLEPDIFIEPEPDNEHDKNALKVVVRKKVFLKKTNFHIGYVPAKLADVICKNDLQNVVKLRITNLLTYENKKLVVICDFIGQSGFLDDKLRKQFDEWEA